MTVFSDVNEMTEFVERVAARTAELTAAKVANSVRAKLGLLRDLINKVHHTVYGDNGRGILGQLTAIHQQCAVRKQDCETCFNLIRAAHSKEIQDLKGTIAAPEFEVRRWKWLFAGAVGLLLLEAGLLAAIANLAKLL